MSSHVAIMGFTFSLGNFRAIYLVSLCCIGCVLDDSRDAMLSAPAGPPG